MSGGHGGRPAGRERKLFLDTSIQIERFWESVPRRWQIRMNLLGKRLYTSSYVLMEFQRTLLKDLAYVLSIVESDCEPSADSLVFLGELIRRLKQRGGDRGSRSIVRSYLVVACICDHFRDTILSREELLEFLRYQLDLHREGFFAVDLTAEGGGVVLIASSNETDCDLVKEGLADTDRRRYHCRRQEAGCRLPAFISRHAASLARVRAAFEAQPKGDHRQVDDPRLRQAAGRLLREPVEWQSAKGQKNCWPLGDTIIALEAPVDAEIYTTDHHYQVICPILGRQLYPETLPGLPALTGRRPVATPPSR